MRRDREDELLAKMRQLSPTQVVELLLRGTTKSASEVPDGGEDSELREQVIAAAARLRNVQREVEREESVPVSRKRGQRILGPYADRAGWRVIEVDAKGRKTSVLFPTERRAQNYVDMLRTELRHEERTTESALTEYKQYLVKKGNKPDSIRQTCYLISAFFGEAISLPSLTQKRIEALYEAMQKQKKKDSEEPRFSVDSHRSALIQSRTFLEWCIGKGWLKENPAVGVQGIGKRRPRGKSLGKEGNELRIKQTRAWYQMALYRAHRDDEGAIAALVELLLGPRPSEIVSRLVADIDEQDEPADVLWIPDSKTPAGRRVLEVPSVLRPFLTKCCEGKGPDQYLFEAEGGGPHWRDWVQSNVQRICDLAGVPRVTAYFMRGQLATITSERGLAGHLLAAHLGHEDENMAQKAYAARGAKAKGVQRRGLAVLEGGLKKDA